MAIDCVAPAGALLGEGPLWDAARGLVWWVDIKSSTLHAHHVASGANRVQRLRTRLTALALASDGMIASGDAGFARLTVDENNDVTIREVIATIDEPAGNRFNDGKVDGAGRFWAGTMDDAEETARGTLYRLDPGGSVTAVRHGIMVPNGPAFLADGTMLTTDSAARTIFAVTLDTDGAPLAERIFARFAGAQGYPDGMAVDTEDHIWVAFWDGWCVRRLSPSGAIVAEIALPVQRPTCPVFAGDALDRLYVTSARNGLDADALTRQPWAGGLWRLDPGVGGRPPERFGG